MNKGKTIFSQIMSLIPERDFKTCVDRYKGNYRARNFSCTLFPQHYNLIFFIST